MIRTRSGLEIPTWRRALRGLSPVECSSYQLRIAQGIFRDDLFPHLNVGEELEFKEHPLVFFEQRSYLVGWVGGDFLRKFCHISRREYVMNDHYFLF